MKKEIDLAKCLTNLAAYLPIIRTDVNNTFKEAENIKDENEKYIYFGHQYMKLIELLKESGIIYKGDK